MRTILLLSVLCLGLFSENLYSQQKAAPDSEALTYTIKANFPVNVSHKYTYTEKSKITREFSDGTANTFNRELKYYFSLRAPNETSKDGFSMIYVSVDSLEYKFEDGQTTVFFNSQADDMRMPGTDDYRIHVIPLGMSYFVTYSPYHEIVKMEGERLEGQREYLLNPATGPSDSLVKNTWLIGLSEFMLNNYFDIIKRIPPDFKASKDTSWVRAIPVALEGSRFLDSVQFSLKQITPRSYVLEGESRSINAIPSMARMFNIQRLMQLGEAKGVSKYTMMMHPRGTVNELKAEYQVEFNYPLLSDSFIQKVETTPH